MHDFGFPLPATFTISNRSLPIENENDYENAWSPCARCASEAPDDRTPTSRYLVPAAAGTITSPSAVASAWIVAGVLPSNTVTCRPAKRRGPR
jgi:hypothetical protein